MLAIASSCLSSIICLHYAIMLLWKNFSVWIFYHAHISLISYLYTRNSEFSFNVPLECITFLTVVLWIAHSKKLLIIYLCLSAVSADHAAFLYRSCSNRGCYLRAIWQCIVASNTERQGYQLQITVGEILLQQCQQTTDSQWLIKDIKGYNSEPMKKVPPQIRSGKIMKTELDTATSRIHV